MAETNNYFDIREALGMLLHRKWLIVIPVILVTAVAYAGSFFIPPEYESQVLVWMGNPVKLTGAVSGMLGQFGEIVGTGRGLQHDVGDLSRQITSLPYVTRLFDRLELDQDRDLQLRAEKMVASQPEISLRDAKLMLLAGMLARQSNLQYVSSSHLKIAVQASDPYLARDMAQTIGEIFVDEAAREELRSIYLSLDFSDEQLARYEKKLLDKRNEKTALEKEIAKWQSDNRISTEANRNDLASEIERRTQEIRDLKQDEADLVARLDRLGQSQFRLDPTRRLTQKKSEVNDLITSFRDLVQDHAWKDPAVSNLTLRVVSLWDDIERQHVSLVDDQYANYDVAIRTELVRLFDKRQRIEILQLYVETLQEGLSALEEVIASRPEYSSQLRQLEREVEVAESLRDRFRAQQEGFEVSQALVEESRFKVQQDARVNLVPVWPDRKVILLIGILAGLFIGGGAVFTVEYSDRSLKKVDQVENYLDLPVVGVVPRVESLGKRA